MAFLKCATLFLTVHAHTH